MALTALQIKNAKTGRHPDGGGLYLQVSPVGTRSWFYRFQIDKKRQEMGLGTLEQTPATKARALAANLKVDVKNGINPIEVKQQKKQKVVAQKVEQKTEQAKADNTFEKFADEFIESFQAAWNNPKHAAQWGATLRAYAYPVIGNVPVADITEDHVLAILKPIWQTKHETATRVRSRIEIILKNAKANKLRTAPNPAVWVDLQPILNPLNTRKTVRNHPALPRQLMGAFMAELRRCDGVAARALEFAILTAARSGEVRGATWSEVDLEKKLWIVPAVHMKAKREHRVPLSSDAIALLEGLTRLEGNDLLFPGARKESALSDMSISAVIKRMNGEKKNAKAKRWVDASKHAAVPHGFRSTFRDWVADETGYANELAEMALAHAVGDAVEAAYRRGDMFAKRVQMMQDWAAFCRAPAKVV